MAPKTKGPAPRDRTCGNCAHYRATDDDPSFGECRLDPPVAMYDVEEGAFSCWPLVALADWCSRHAGAH